MNYFYALLTRLTTWKLSVSDDVNSALSGYGSKDNDATQMWIDVLKKIATIVDQFLPVAMIVLGIVAAIYVTILGAKYSSSESDDQKNEVKKKLINGIIGFAIGLVIMIVMFVFLNNVPAIANWINDTGKVK